LVYFKLNVQENIFGETKENVGEFAPCPLPHPLLTTGLGVNPPNV